MQQPVLIDHADVRRIYGVTPQDRGRSFWITHVAAHQRVTLTGNQSVLGDDELRVLHGSAQTARYALAAVIVIGGNDTRLRRGVSVVEPRLWQQLAQRLHVSL